MGLEQKERERDAIRDTNGAPTGCPFRCAGREVPWRLLLVFRGHYPHGRSFADLCWAETMFLGELADLVILVSRHTATVGLSHLGFIVGHYIASSSRFLPKRSPDEPLLFPLRRAATRPHSDSFCVGVLVCVMASPSLWSGNLRLSLVLIPVRLVPAISTEEAISFRQIHEPSGTPIRYVKGVHEGDTFTEVPDEEIVKGYEYTKGSHVLIDPKEIDDLKLEAKHTIDMVRFVDEEEIDTRYWEKPYYLVPDGDEADEGYAIMQRALAETGKVAIGQLIMGGRAHLVGIKALKGGLMLSILRYANELRDFTPYFEGINIEAEPEAMDWRRS
jgi:Ku protein